MKQASHNKQKTQTKKKAGKRSGLLPAVAVVVAAAAALAVLAAKLLPRNTGADTGGEAHAAVLSEDGTALVIDTAALSESASFFDYDVDGTTVELFAVMASDGTVRLALNTCQVCNGSPYAYFVQEGDYFICQNCQNHFASTQVGLVSGGCNPVPITEEDYSQQDGTILVPVEFLRANAGRFTNWKNF